MLWKKELSSSQRPVDRHIELLLLPNDVTWTKACAAIGSWLVLVEVIKTENDLGLVNGDQHF